ncbi:DUF805 domain-containing protein [Elstera cyanobacteriorum]|uniref:DUF805 domain-containing protein n=1 Tax=Elstera cyanobacteriorum TaxID=2022747 RepID=A0A255XMQ6_9PROT|nr:DUF805 domain-containing protein [Elstera cyanobacteriorum]OYQ18161.1 DUF805 domain-containing protein [Elstera cyanobacteriorum]GFZ83314.1 DUF805 domain-containing protein [Elstera cyanobacteriorum]
MNFPEAIASCFRQFFEFKGRAARSEYWYFTLFSFLTQILGGVLDDIVGANGALSGFVGLALFFPSLAVLFRRLHDIDRTGWWWLLTFVPILGWIVLIVFCCTKGTVGPNRFGEGPLAGHA